MMKVRMKNQIGDEFEFEGDDKAFSAVGGQLARWFDHGRAPDGVHRDHAPGPKRASGPPLSDETLTTNSIAVLLGFKSRGPGLVLAAAAKLTFYDRKETFSRGELLGEMRSATGIFTLNHRKNLSTSLRKLISERKLNEHSKDLYALVPEAYTDIAAKLGFTLPR